MKLRRTLRRLVKRSIRVVKKCNCYIDSRHPVFLNHAEVFPSVTGGFVCMFRTLFQAQVCTSVVGLRFFAAPEPGTEEKR